jgi:mRNA interferase RelE/StbE
VSLAWRVELDEAAQRDLKKLGPSTARQIARYLREKLATPESPRRFGKPLSGKLHGLWRWRAGDHRILGRIEDHVLVVFVIRIGHRKNVYD